MLGTDDQRVAPVLQLLGDLPDDHAVVYITTFPAHPLVQAALLARGIQCLHLVRVPRNENQSAALEHRVVTGFSRPASS